nr:isoform 3 of hbs1-like protein [Quercus suber]
MGRLLLDTGAVSQRDVDKLRISRRFIFYPAPLTNARYKKQAAELGKASFALAWVMDTGSEERERGVTVDVAQHHFATDSVEFTILDAPGHRDFVPNMIGGASMADVAVLVVDASQLESGMKGQTREHILLAKTAGIKRVVVAINKLDSTTPPWNESLFVDVSADLVKLLKQTGFAEDEITMVPCSGLSGLNVVKPAPSSSPTGWVAESYPTLLHALEGYASDASSSSLSLLRAPLRLQIADVFRGGITNPLSISGRIASGTLQTGETLLIQPSGESASIKALEIADEARDYAVTGQIVTLHLADVEAQHLRVGDAVCTPAHPVRVLRTYTAKVEAVQSLLPQDVDVHIGRLHGPGRVATLVATVDATGGMLKKKPKIVKEGQHAIVKIVVAAGAPVDVGDRFVLRSAGVTMGFGVVEELGEK